MTTKVTTRWTATGVVAFVLAVVGLGLQLGGFRVTWLGWALIAFGIVVGMASGLLWLWPKIAVAAVKTAHQHGYQSAESALAKLDR